MKKWIWILLLALVLCGCTDEEMPVFETVGEGAYEQVNRPEPGQIAVLIPEEAISEAMADGSGGQLYSWGDHTLQLQTLDGGDIRTTVETLSGFSYEDLTVMQYAKNGFTYYQTVWSTAGEDGAMLGRALIADDGYYHYCISLLSAEESDSQKVYDQLCASFSIRSGDGVK